jgi:vacuolar-type H+-ATPase subunit C/Vma6
MPSVSSTMYGYSSTRVKAMESRLLDRSTLNQLAKMENVGSMIGLLLQTNYKQYLEQFGGKDVHDELIDFALSKSLEVDVKKLIAIVPKEQKEMTAHIVGRSDTQNIKLIFYAKVTGKSFDDVSKYVVESYNIDNETMKRALEEQTLDGAVEKLAVRTPYSVIVRDALATYKKTGNLTEVNATIDMGFYRELESAVRKLSMISSESATVVRLDMEMRNILALLRAKKYNMSADKLKNVLLQRGITPVDKLLEIFETSKDIDELAGNVKSFDLKHAVDLYEKGNRKRMLIFEISMRNAIFKRAVSLLQHSTLSYAVILGYFYLKEMEVFTLRILINGKSYGLSKDEVDEMINWQT